MLNYFHYFLWADLEDSIPSQPVAVLYESSYNILKYFHSWLWTDLKDNIPSQPVAVIKSTQNQVADSRIPMKISLCPIKFLSGFLMIYVFIFFHISDMGLAKAYGGYQVSLNSRALKKFQHSIVDYRKYISKKFKKIIRKRTRYIIIHTSELGKSATLKVVSRGKYVKSGYKTPGGHAHYVIARNGKTYRILDKKYRADHAGLSMWQGQENISDISIGIELVGYHDAPLTDRQYQSVAMLLKILKKVYSLSDKDVLTHSQIAYGNPNPWFHKNHRGRKRCAKNFDRKKAGLRSKWTYDPDVRSGKLLPDPYLSSCFYIPDKKTPVRNQPSNIITSQNSAWSIAGEKYNQASTIYILPDGKKIKGNHISSLIGWKHLPIHTRVLINQNIPDQKSNLIKTIQGGSTAWSYAGIKYNSKHTFYILPSGKIIRGINISDWDDLPMGTRLITDYKGPYLVTKKKTPFSISGRSYKSKGTIYYIPPCQLITGNEITRFTCLPKGTKIFLPLRP